MDGPEIRFANYFEIAFTDSHFLLEFGQAYEDGEPVIQARIAAVPKDVVQLLQILTEVLRRYEERYPGATERT